MQISSAHRESEADSKWDVLKTMAQAVGVLIGYLLVLVAMLSILEPQGMGWTLATAGAGLAAGTAAFFLAKRAGRKGLAILFSKNERDAASNKSKV
jgi:hypothetical protein